MTDADPERVVENDGLKPAEKETTLRFGKDEDRATVHTDEAGIMRRLLQHDHTDDLETVERDGCIVAVRASIPVGAVTIKAEPRSSGTHADVVTASVLRE